MWHWQGHTSGCLDVVNWWKGQAGRCRLFKAVIDVDISAFIGIFAAVGTSALRTVKLIVIASAAAEVTGVISN